jgi:hypothetical protein
MSLQDIRQSGRPVWLPHPALLTLIAALWLAAATAQLLG